ncbi:hypothetical protein A4G99_03310 [Haladaptatus sp. R4]|uniref:hypothetical protein n=1 Tax=Haladaptatus sp. R4 TaxID=1679489 RepID=UPI0007B46A60|nr:hypothetical protein [Haladaptatus sp. R4]KZN25519.1 hypothetical protein A4G99_03310 [Haladaptatus sp. R4]
MQPRFTTDHHITEIDFLAAIFGVIIGVLAGYASEHGFRSVAIAGGVLFIGLSLGVGVNGTMPGVHRKLRREPWYALAAFLMGGALGTLP